MTQSYSTRPNPKKKYLESRRGKLFLRIFTSVKQNFNISLKKTHGDPEAKSESEEEDLKMNEFSLSIKKKFGEWRKAPKANIQMN